MNTGKFSFAIFGFWTGFAGTVAAAPQAGLVGRSWQLDFEFHDPQRITVNGTNYWYIAYRVTNHTGQDVEFYPSFRLVTNTLHVVEGGDGVSPIVYDSVFARHRQEFPFFTRPTKITGLLLQGEANARESAVVFRTFDPEAARFTIFAGGLSGEIERIKNPAFDKSSAESDANPRAFLLRRTLAIVYDIPGDPQTRSGATPIRKSREWVMR